MIPVLLYINTGNTVNFINVLITLTSAVGVITVTVKELINLSEDCLKELKLYTSQPVPLMGEKKFAFEKLLCTG